jgi:hypothetical protein
MIEDDLSRVEDSATKFTYKLGLVWRDVRIKVKIVLPSLFLAPIITKRKKHSNQLKPTTHPVLSHPSTPREV